MAIPGVSRPRRIAAFVCIVGLCAAVAGFVAGNVLPALGLPDLYGTAITGAVGAVAIASFWVLLGEGFDGRGYLEAGRVACDVVLVIASALLVAAGLVAAMTAAGIADASARAGEAFVAAGPRLVATAGGVGAGLYAFYRRNRARFAR